MKISTLFFFVFSILATISVVFKEKKMLEGKINKHSLKAVNIDTKINLLEFKANNLSSRVNQLQEQLERSQASAAGELENVVEKISPNNRVNLNESANSTNDAAKLALLRQAVEDNVKIRQAIERESHGE